MHRPISIRRLLTALTCSALAATAVASTDWPEPVCEDADYWLKFARMDVCIDPERVRHINHLDQVSPTVALTLSSDTGTDTALSLTRLTDKRVTGGLHTRFGLSVRDFLQQVIDESYDEGEQAELVRTILSVNGATRYQYFQRSDLEAFVLYRQASQWDTIILLKDGEPGAIQLSGQLSREDVTHWLARLRW